MVEIDTRRADRIIRIFVWTIFTTGLLMPTILAVLGLLVHVGQGFEVHPTTWGWGPRMIILLTIYVLMPMGILACAGGWSLRNAASRSCGRYYTRLHVLGGAYAGATISLSSAIGVMLLRNIEGLAYLVALWPFSIPLIFLCAAIGIAVGGTLGWLLWRVRLKLRERGPE